MAKPGPKPAPLSERFWKLVDKSGDCWLWQASRKGKGYGCFRVNKQSIGAHRVSYELTHGPIPDGMYVLHKCDTPLCVRPDHLFLGTHADNMADRNAKHRQARPQGTLCGMAKLTEAQVLEIRRLHDECGVSQVQLGKRFGVDRTNVLAIVRRKTWTHL